MREKVVATLKVCRFRCGCGEHYDLYMERTPKPPEPKVPKSGESYESYEAYFRECAHRSGFTKIDPADFGVKLRDGMRLRVTFEVIEEGKANHEAE